MTFLEKSLFKFYNIITRFIFHDVETNRNETKTQCLKNQSKRNISEKPKRFRSNFRLEHLSVAKCRNPDHSNWYHTVQISGNLSFSSAWEMYKFLCKTYSLWQCMNNMVPSNETRWYWNRWLTLHLPTVQAFSVLNISTVTTHCCRTIFQGGKKHFTLNMFAI